MPGRRSLSFLLAALTLTLALGQSDLVYRPAATGSRVVESVLQILKDSCLDGDDTDFLRRLAHVQSRDGLDPMTFRAGYDGGIWQVDQDKFRRTLQEASRLTSQYALLKSKLGIDWAKVTWSDLLTPLYSGIAAALYLQLLQTSTPVPTDIQGQANYWHTNFRPTQTAQKFVDDVTKFEQTYCDQAAKLDLIYAVDTSSSVTESQLAQVKGHIKAQIGRLARQDGLGLDGARLALVTYSTRAILAFPLERSIEAQSLGASVDLAPRAGGSTNTSDAFQMVKRQVLPTARPDAVKVIVLVTDGKSNDVKKTLDEVIPLKGQGVQIVTVGIGGNVDPKELDSLATVPACQYARRLQTYSELSSLALKFRQRTCSEPIDLQPGEYTFPCSQNVLARLPKDGRAYSLNIRVSDGEADILTSYATGNPSQQDKDFGHRLVASQPVVLKDNDTQSLAVKVVTDRPGQGHTGAKSCKGNFTITIDLDTTRRQQCNNHYLDLLLLVDSAVANDYQSVQQLMDFSTQFVNQWDVGQDRHRVGVATFDQSVHSLLTLKSTDSVPQFLTGLQQLPASLASSSQTGQGSDLAAALKWTRQVGLSSNAGARPTSTRIVLVITSGTPTNMAAVQLEGRLLQSEGIRAVVVALGTIFDDVTLSSIASSPVRVIKATDIKSVTSSIDALNNATCGSVQLTCVENGVKRECTAEDLINSQYSPIVVGDRNSTTNPCALPDVPGLPPITRFPHPSRKDRFLICDSKKQAYVVLCPLGELYNSYAKECEVAPPTKAPPTSASTASTSGSNPPMTITLVPQTAKTTSPPAPSSTLSYLDSVCSYNNVVKGDRLHEYPGYKNKYVNCSLITGKGQIMTCPQGQWWVQASLACRFVCPIVDASTGQVDCSVPNPCNGALVYYPHQRDPNKFIQCNSRKEAFVLTCPVSQIWKPQLAACDIP